MGGGLRSVVLVIDGYNVLHALCPGSGRVVAGGAAMGRFLEVLGAGRYGRREAVVVCDGEPGPRTAGDVERIAALLTAGARRRLEYAGRGHEADEVIERMLAEAASGGGAAGMLVVSGDARLRLAAQRMGAGWMSSAAFVAQIMDDWVRRGDRSVGTRGPEGGVAQWVAYFGITEEDERKIEAGIAELSPRARVEGVQRAVGKSVSRRRNAGAGREARVIGAMEVWSAGIEASDLDMERWLREGPKGRWV